MSNDAPTPKSRKRNSAKSQSRHDDAKVKVTLYVPADLAKRFAVHATYSEMDRSQLFSEMIRDCCKRYVVSDRSKSPDEPSEETAA